MLLLVFVQCSGVRATRPGGSNDLGRRLACEVRDPGVGLQVIKNPWSPINDVDCTRQILMLFDCSGDQDSVIPLTGSRTLVQRLANELGLKTTVPYRVWFEGEQVNRKVIRLRSHAPHCLSASEFSRVLCAGRWMDASLR